MADYDGGREATMSACYRSSANRPAAVFSLWSNKVILSGYTKTCLLKTSLGTTVKNGKL